MSCMQFLRSAGMGCGQCDDGLSLTAARGRWAAQQTATRATTPESQVGGGQVAAVLECLGGCSAACPLHPGQISSLGAVA